MDVSDNGLYLKTRILVNLPDLQRLHPVWLERLDRFGPARQFSNRLIKLGRLCQCGPWFGQLPTDLQQRQLSEITDYPGYLQWFKALQLQVPALDAAAALAKEGVDVEVIDLRTLSPIDMDTVLESVEKTGRLVCVDEANPRCSIAADVSAQVAQQAFSALKGPIEMVTPPHVPVPFSPVLEDLYIPSAAQVVAAVKKTMAGGRH